MTTNRSTIPNTQTFYKTISIIHLALIAGQILFGITAFFIVNSTNIVMNPPDDIFFYLVPLLAFTGIIAGSYLFKQKLNGLANVITLKEKLAIWQTAVIIRFAMAEGPSLLGIAAYLNTGNLFYLFISGLIILYFIWIAPKKQNITDELDLSYEEKIEMGF
jgi:hypothetical protein